MIKAWLYVRFLLNATAYSYSLVVAVKVLLL